MLLPHSPQPLIGLAGPPKAALMTCEFCPAPAEVGIRLLVPPSFGGGWADVAPACKPCSMNLGAAHVGPKLERLTLDAMERVKAHRRQAMGGEA